ncbi:MAG: S8 family serine peptidase [Alphaproteobacteria bacterium]|nr:S8 family serine peptidase [Alphaproteobacteria bacterium]
MLFCPRSLFHPLGQAHAHRARSSRLTVIGVMLVVAQGCGGGGGGGASSTPGSTPRLIITRPQPLPPSGASELDNTPALALVQAAQIYDLDMAGAGHQVAVLDSGVDASHPELAGRVIGGGDFQNNSEDGRVDPNGHGTHVASIIAAAKDDFGIFGIVPDAEIVSYRILNARGVFGGKSGEQMIPVILNDVDSRDLPVVNNSWSSFYEINDFPAATIEASLGAELDAYQNKATAAGPVLVWAAGNGSDGNVSIRSGLPYYFPELEDNWLAVVAVDVNGKEPNYTNRCGLAADWCLTAPGGGDSRSVNGIEAANAGGGYTRKSGTSMAAPVVSGALTLLMEAMPTLSPRQAAARLKETATYDGLETADGCTVDSCSDAQMQEVFGHGLIQVADALQPIGDASIITSLGPGQSATTTYLVTPGIMGDSVKRALDGAMAVVHDGFDGAMFLTPLDVRVVTAEPSVELGHQAPPAFSTIAMPMGLVTSFAPTAPAVEDLPARLIDIPARDVDGWHGVHLKDHELDARVMMGHGHDRQAVHLVLQHNGHDDNPGWVGGGIDRSNDWLDGYSSGGFGLDGATSQWLFAGRSLRVGGAVVTAEALMGQTRLAPTSGGIVSSASIQYDAWSLQLDQPVGAVDWQVAITQPPGLRSGHITLEQPSGLSASGAEFTSRRYDLKLGARERHNSLSMATSVFAESELKASVHYIENYGHRAGISDQQLSVSLNLNF